MDALSSAAYGPETALTLLKRASRQPNRPGRPTKATPGARALGFTVDWIGLGEEVQPEAIWDFLGCVWSPSPACRRQYPAGLMEFVRSYHLFASAFPESGAGRLLHRSFEACSAFTHVMACMLAESPMRPFTPKASAASLPPPQLRLLPGGANQFPGGFTLAVDHRLFTAHPVCDLTGLGTSNPALPHRGSLIRSDFRRAHLLNFQRRALRGV